MSTIIENNSRQNQTMIYNFGDRGSGLRSVGQVQDFYKIRDRCLANEKLFEDPDFPAVLSSVYHSGKQLKNLEWKRPSELVSDPRFFVQGPSRFDVVQGILGDCWLLASVANLTLYPKLFERVVPQDQSFSKNYAGIFHFRFWQYGKWIDVVIDDRLPTREGKLLFLQSKEKNEFWSALLEKAYAKLHGSYESLEGGLMLESFEDFTGGLCETYELALNNPNLFHIMLKAWERSSFMGCFIPPHPGEIENELPNGLICGHAYSITAVKEVEIESLGKFEKCRLLRIRNPWGNQHEWNGSWSDGSVEWHQISEDNKRLLGITFDVDGEFWMAFSDFTKYFKFLDICNLSPDALKDEVLNEKSKKRWETHLFEGDWTPGISAGGCINHKDSFSFNPQYCITLEDPDEDDDEVKCTVIIALMQKTRRKQKKMGTGTLAIGFVVYELPDHEKLTNPLDSSFFNVNKFVSKPSFHRLRETVGRFKLSPGRYCIVPSTFEPDQEGEFILRVFSENKNEMREFDDLRDFFGRKHADSEHYMNETNLEEINLREEFHKVAGDDLEVDAYELKKILKSTFHREFEISLCRSMIALSDSDRSGKLGFHDFLKLQNSIMTWTKIFQTYDKDKSDSLNKTELKLALNSAGFYLNLRILKVLVLRYANKDGTMAFEDFIGCAVKLKNMIDIFRTKASEKVKEGTFRYEEWLETTMYA